MYITQVVLNLFLSVRQDFIFVLYMNCKFIFFVNILLPTDEYSSSKSSLFIVFLNCDMLVCVCLPSKSDVRWSVSDAQYVGLRHARL